MLKPGVRGNLLLAFAVIVAGAATGIAISYSARAQVGTFDDDTEYGNPGGASTYCVYDVSRTNGRCGSIGTGSVICSTCTKPADCPDYGQGNTRENAQIPGVAGCEVFVQSRGNNCHQCDVGGFKEVLAPLP
jgi:hypothetical protein